jgi:hypothetical protein
MNKQHQDPANELYSISSALESAICLKRDPTANDLTWSLIAWAQGTAEEAADRLMREQPSPINSHRLAELLAQLADTLEQTDLCPVERAQFAALLAALRVEASTCQEVAA